MRVALVVAVICVCTGPLARGTGHQAQTDLASMLDAYYAGNYDDAITRATRLPDLGPLRLQFVQQTQGWIARDPAKAEARRAAVAGFVVELAGARLEDDWGRLSDLIEWTCVHILRSAGPPTEFERRWHMATTALAGRARVRLWLLGPYARLPHQKPATRPPSKDDPPSPLHLMHAIERYPDDPHFQLARVIAWTWGRDDEPARNARRREDEYRPRGYRPAQLEAITAFEPLTRVPEVAAEAWIRTGLINVTVADHAAALKAFAAALPLARTSQLKYLAHFLAGRSHEVLQQPDEAIAQYRRALDVVPAAESATIALASLLFLRGEAAPSIAMIDKRFAGVPAARTLRGGVEATDASSDPGRLVGYGAYVHWPEIKAAMRAELRK